MNIQDYQNAALRTAPEDHEIHVFERVIHRTQLINRIGSHMPPDRVGRQATIYMSMQDSVGLLHAILGIVGEISEFDDAFCKSFEDPEATEETRLVVAKEFGDIWWYVALAAKCMNWDFVELVGNAAAMGDDLTDDEVRLKPHEVSEPLKKWLFYGKAIDSDELLGAVTRLMGNATALAGRLAIDIEEAHRINIDKLRARFPEKFDEVTAQNHNSE